MAPRYGLKHLGGSEARKLDDGRDDLLQPTREINSNNGKKGHMEYTDS